MSDNGVLFVLFGATGDLARRELVPWIVDLARRGTLGEPFRLLGVARDPAMDDAGFQKLVAESVTAAGRGGDDLAAWCGKHVRFHTAYEPGHYDDMARLVRSIEQDGGLSGNRAYYLSLPPSAFAQVIDEMGRVGLAKSPGWTRLVIEKPFGRDLDSAQALNATVHRAFDESQIYRIDHFVGKETVQNLLVFRFANPLFESVWNRDRIAHVQITVAEDIGIKTRGAFYEQTGCLRDMVQNHLTQLLTMVAMEVPAAYDADSVRFEKVKVLRSMAPLEEDDVVFGQYAAGVVHGKPVHGYREEGDVAKDSTVETFVALRAHVNTWRWHGVPFYLRTGKRLPRRLTEIVVTFKEPPVRLFETMQCRLVPPNRLVMRLQPDEGFSLLFDVKRPGEPLLLENLPLHFDYAEAFGALPTAYETLLAEVVQGDQTLFVHADEVIGSWKKYTPLLERGLPVHHYSAGSWGPAEADALLARDGHAWYVGK
ncbi:MAG: glucose-6-phosphate dehydrogenase [Planctomycetes bacterium]|nr:glucose-6-phosphate dehydrogenase [Planctomycetota bacterium]